jgi:probable HAF family extracellular repeat protein
MKCLELVFQRVNKLLGLWILVLAPFYAAPAGAQSYSITNLGVLPGGTYSFSTGLNAKGEATGYGDASQGSVRAWRYSHGALIDLGTLGTSYSLTYAYDINDHGDVTGYSFTAEGDARAFLYHDGKMQDIGTLGGTESGGYAINNAGEITGVSDILYDTGAAAFIYLEGTMRSLGGLGGTDGNGLGINNTGEITGWAFTEANLLQHAFLYRNGAMYDLGALGGAGYALNSHGLAINDSSEVVGDSQLPGASSNSAHAFLYQNGSMKDLGTLGGSWSGAAGINSAGEIVGGSLTVTDTDSHAFLYSKGSMKDLNSLIDPADPLAMRVTLTSAVAINRRRQILANGREVQGGVTAYLSYLLTPKHCLDERSRTANGRECGQDDSNRDDCDRPCGGADARGQD